MGLHIRRATENDALGIAKVHIQSWKETYAGIVSQEYLDSLNVEDRLKLWKTSLSQNPNGAPVFVALNNSEKIIGFASFGEERTGELNADAELYAIYILEKYKRGKLGTKLVLAGIEELLGKKFRSMLVWVLEENGSRKFYENMHPQKAAVEVIKIGDREHVEIAYLWENLNLLRKNIISVSEKGIL